jgi:hypothetical protein
MRMSASDLRPVKLTTMSCLQGGVDGEEDRLGWMRNRHRR